jgi:signal transduction histidine kinase
MCLTLAPVLTNSSARRTLQSISRALLAATQARPSVKHSDSLNHAAERFGRVPKSEFLANMSHELRTPMHAILSFSRLGTEKIARGDVPIAKIQQYLARIDQGGERLLKLLNGLLDLSKLEAGKMVYQMVSADMGAIVAACVAQIEGMARAKRITLRVEGAEAPRTAWCDEARVGQVLLNLLSNAIQFSQPGSSVTVELGLGRLDRGGDHVRAVMLSISDRGVGIPDDELQTVFDKFVQSSKTKTGSGGTGLGLAICREIVQDHDGRIWAENIPAGGARFSFLLPVCREEVSAIAVR